MVPKTSKLCMDYETRVEEENMHAFHLETKE